MELDTNIITAIISTVGSFLLTEIGKYLHSKKESKDTVFFELYSEVTSNLEILNNAKIEFENSKNNQFLIEAAKNISIEKLNSKTSLSIVKKCKKQDQTNFCNAYIRAIENTKGVKRDFQKDDYWNNKRQVARRISTLIEKFEILKTYFDNI